MRLFRAAICLLLCLFCQNYDVFAGQDSYINKERKAYLEAQVSDLDKIYLEKLKDELMKMSKLNEATSYFWAAWPDIQEVIKKVEQRFNEASDKAAAYIFGPEQVSQNFAQDLGDFVVKNLPQTGKAAFAAALGKGITYGAEVINLMQFLKTSMEISDLLKDTNNGVQRWSGYTLELMKMDRTPVAILSDSSDEFERAAAFASASEIKELKWLLSTDIPYFEGKIERIESHILFHTGGDNDWCKALLSRLLPMTLQQLKVNRDFCLGVLARVEQIPTPKEPSWPSLIVTSLEVRIPEGKKIEELRLGDEVIVSAEIKNNGDLNAHSCLAGLQLCEEGSGDCTGGIVSSLEKDLPDLNSGASCKVEWREPLRFLKNTFIVFAKSEGEEWSDISLGKRIGVGFSLVLAPELSVKFAEIPEKLYVNKKAKIKVSVRNDGNISSHIPKVTLTASGEELGEINLNDIERKKSSDATFEWTPKEKRTYDLICEVTPGTADKKDLDKTNNRVSAKVEVFLPQDAWEIDENSIMINPANPKVGDAADIYFTVTNHGTKTKVSAEVFVDKERLKFLTLNVPSEGQLRVGGTPADKVTWRVSGGTHTIKIVLEPSRDGGLASAQKIFSIATLMPGVQGIDLVLDKKWISTPEGQIMVKIYNRGSQTAPNPLLVVKQYRSYNKEPESFVFSRNLSDIKPHELRSIAVEMACRDCKLVITVDEDNRIKEVDENNNRVDFLIGSYHPYTAPRDIRAEGPDLIVANVVNLDRPLEVNETRAVTIVIGNPNLVDVGQVKVGYEFWNLALNDITPIHGYLKGERILSSVPKEESVSFNVDYEGVYPADYKLTVHVDPDAKIAETNEYNNELVQYFSVSGEITSEIFFRGKGVDLAIDKNIKVSNLQPPAGVPVNFKVVAHNYTGIDVWGADVDMLIDDKLEAGQALGTFGANSSRTLSFQHTFVASGDYMVKFMVDAKKAVPEKDEDNNIVTTVVKVKPGIFGTGHKDVAVTSLTLSKSSCMQGELVKAEATIKNLGKDTLNGVLCTIGPSAKQSVYLKVIPVFDPGEELKITTTLPALIAGNYKIEARVDGANIIKEENETNNVVSAPLQVEPITQEQVKQKAAEVAVDKVSAVIQTINDWLRNIGKKK